MQAADLLEQHDDLNRECTRLHRLVDGLSKLNQRPDNSAEAIEAAGLPLSTAFTPGWSACCYQ